MNARPALAVSPATGAGLADIGIVGNGQITALVRADGEVPWCCWPRPDGDPVFCALLSAQKDAASARGSFAISLVGETGCSMRYVRNTAVLESRAWDARGNIVKITTWCPRFVRHGRLYRPAMLMRRV